MPIFINGAELSEWDPQSMSYYELLQDWTKAHSALRTVGDQ